MNKYDPHTDGQQYLEDMATAYWYSETLFAAVEMDIFSLLEAAPSGAPKLAEATGCDAAALDRLMKALETLGLTGIHEDTYYNNPVASRYLVKGATEYQGGSILWRKYLAPYWSELAESVRQGGRTVFSSPSGTEDDMTERRRGYIKAMDAVARCKARELLDITPPLRPDAEILDVGAGSGGVSAAFLEANPSARATLADIGEILGITAELMTERGLETRASYLPMNALEPWPVGDKKFDLIILSNILHAFGDDEAGFVLSQAAGCLAGDGIILIHDFFTEHYSEKAAAFDLNMLVNTYNGKVYSTKWVVGRLAGMGLECTALYPLNSDTAALFSGKNVAGIAGTDNKLKAAILDLGFSSVREIDTSGIKTGAWVNYKCRHGCGLHARCRPEGGIEALLAEYSRGLLIEGQPPTADFQLKMLKAEKTAFLADYYKAAAFWAGPCSLCEKCSRDDKCARPASFRVSMESAGIDVFATVRGAGMAIKTLNEGEYVKYFGLLLLE